MYLELASKIKRVVELLSNTWISNPYTCELVNELGEDDTWECHLYSGESRMRYRGELWALGLAIEKAGCGIKVRESFIYRGETGQIKIDTICIY